MTQSLVWRLLDLDEVQGRPVDLVIATKFPSYVVRHPNKVVWLVHQFRQAYELDRTELGEFGEEAFDRAARRAVHRLDRATLSEAQRLFAISENVASRLEQSLGLEAEVLRPPPQPLEYRCDEYGDFVLSVGRLDRAKRVDLLLEAAAADGEPARRDRRRGAGPRAARGARGDHRLDGRVTFTGRLDDDALADQYARCLAVFYAPIDEDLGFVPYEAFLAEKPVVTTTRRGRPARGRRGPANGARLRADSGAVAEALAWLRAASRRGSRPGPGRQGRGRAARPGTRPSTGCSAHEESRTTRRCRPTARGSPTTARTCSPRSSSGSRSRSRSSRRRAPRGCDVALYHVGNNPDAHGWIVEAFRKRPGIVVLHDVVLHHLVAGMTVGRGQPDGYLDAMQRDSGVVGRLLAHGVVDGLLQPLWEDRAADFPLTMWVVEPATGIIVHSHFAEQWVRELGFTRAGVADPDAGLAGPAGRGRIAAPRTSSSAASAT